jgi:4-diphosphocytidyl-2-C-methyl-D-erythritol kinase
MISYPNAKINLGLNVVEKRSDGYHNIESVFYPVPLCDILEILPSASGEATFQTSGLPVPGPHSENLCLKAFDIIQSAVRSPQPADFSPQSAVRRPPSALSIYLHKQLPTGSGLGGGSSDGAFALKMMNEIFGLFIDEEKMVQMALRLGSDCPFFIRNRPAFAEGRGEILSDINVDLKGYFLALVIPPVQVSTAQAYGMLTPGKPPVSVKEITALSVDSWKDKLGNDFEKPVFEKFPEIGEVKKKLYGLGAIYASMSGSGSAVYGLFRNPVSLAGHFPITYFSQISQI